MAYDPLTSGGSIGGYYGYDPMRLGGGGSVRCYKCPTCGGAAREDEPHMCSPLRPDMPNPARDVQRLHEHIDEVEKKLLYQFECANERITDIERTIYALKTTFAELLRTLTEMKQ